MITKQKLINTLINKREVWNRWARAGGPADLAVANLTGADLRFANLRRANLRDADLRLADLSGTDLRDANLTRADLTGADLTRADLRRADLTRANLRDADLRRADLTHADLRFANLRRADLTGADLTRADLRRADLRLADLSGTDLRDANLSGTCLDPTNECSAPKKVRARLEELGINVNARGNFVAWRTQRSVYSGNTVYEPGTTYRAAWFSTDESTECHPGLYFGTKDDALGLSKHVVRVVTNIRHVVVAGSKLRGRMFRVVKGSE